MYAENPFCIIITGDSNCRSTQWWKNDIGNMEGKLFEPLASDNGLHQLTSEPTHLMAKSKSCINLLFTDEPNLIIESGVHPSLHDQCHHQNIYGKLSVSNIVLPLIPVEFDTTIRLTLQPSGKALKCLHGANILTT